MKKNIQKFLLLVICFVTLHANATTVTFTGLGASNTADSGFKTLSDKNLVVSNEFTAATPDIYVNDSSTTELKTLIIKADGVDAESFDISKITLYAFNVNGITIDASSTIVFKDKNNAVIQTMSLNGNKSMAQNVDKDMFVMFDIGTTSPVIGVSKIEFNFKINGCCANGNNFSSLTFKNITYNNVVSPSSSTLVEKDLVAGSGDKRLTYDSATGFSWLDVDYFIGKSRQQVVSLLEQDNSLHFRWATGDEVSALYSAAGITISNMLYPGTEGKDLVIPEITQMAALQTMLGLTTNDGDYNADNQSYSKQETLGYTSIENNTDGNGLISYNTARISYQRNFRGFAPPLYRYNKYQVTSNDSSYYLREDQSITSVGHFLIQLVPPPAITSATYDASTGTLVIIGTDLSTGDVIDETKLKLTGDAGETYTLIDNGTITASNTTTITINLNATNKMAVNTILNKNGTSSSSSTTYNLAASTNWNITSNDESAESIQPVIVSNVDSTPPIITALSIPNTPMKVGDTVIATITIPSDSDDYTTGSGAISGTIGGFTLGSLTKTNDTTYTATFTVTDGGTDVASDSSIPVSVKLTDSSGNQMGTAFTTAISQASDSIDANKPTLSLISTSNITAKTIDLKATSNETGVMYFSISTTSSIPTANDMLTNKVSNSIDWNYRDVSANVEKIYSVSGLSANTKYYYYIMSKDTTGSSVINTSIISNGSFTTKALDTDSTLTGGTSIDESSMISIPTTVKTLASKVNVFDFKITDLGTGDALSTDIEQIDIAVSGTAVSNASKITWILNGPNVTDKVGTVSNNTITFSSLSSSISDGGNGTYTLSAYWNNPTGLTDNQTFGLTLTNLNIGVNTDKSTLASNQSVTNNTNAKVDVTATKLIFSIQPSNVGAI